MHKKIMDKLKNLNKNQILIGVAVLAVVATGVLVSSKSNPALLSFLKFNSGLSTEAIAKKSVDYLNKSVLQNGQIATLVSVSDLKGSGVVQIKIKIADKTYDSYATKDGKLLFPEAFTIGSGTTASAVNNTQPSNNQTAQNTQDTQDNKPQITPANVAKVAKTSLDAYVVSRCPFGLQMQRAMAEAIKNVPSLAEYTKVRYIGAVSSDGKTITAMHGNEEAQENLRQICIREEQPTKYWPYVACQMKSKDAADGCLSSTGVNVAKLNSCMSDPSKGVAYAKVDFALQNKFGVQGSPTLILNEQEISENSFGGRSADAIRNIVCSSSTTQSSFCSTKLNATPAATSFSPTY